MLKVYTGYQLGVSVAESNTNSDYLEGMSVTDLESRVRDWRAHKEGAETALRVATRELEIHERALARLLLAAEVEPLVEVAVGD